MRLTGLFALLLTSGHALAAGSQNATVPCARSAGPQPFSQSTWRVGSAFGFSSSRLKVDADGAPNSYRVDGKGLSETCVGAFAVVDGKEINQHSGRRDWCQLAQDALNHAVKSGDYSGVKIVGLETGPDHKPIVQGKGDPLPGEAFVTTTSMPVPGTLAGTQRHYVDASTIPYISLDQHFAGAIHAAHGDVAVVYRPSTGRIAYAVWADCCSFGEASIRLHQDLGHDPVVVEQGVRRAASNIEDRVITLIFPGKQTHGVVDPIAWEAEIKRTGEAALGEWGGPDRLKACSK